MVSGLLIQTRTTDKGRLALNQMAQKAAASIWKGIGIKQNQTPTRKALATQCRLMCHRLGSWRMSPRKRSDCIDCTFSGVGKYRFMNFFGIGSSACFLALSNHWRPEAASAIENRRTRIVRKPSYQPGQQARCWTRQHSRLLLRRYLTVSARNLATIFMAVCAGWGNVTGYVLAISAYAEACARDGCSDAGAGLGRLECRYEACRTPAFGAGDQAHYGFRLSL